MAEQIGTTLNPPDRQGDPVARGAILWRLDADGTLRSRGHAWSPGANRAACSLYPKVLHARWRRMHPNGVPGSGCVCGFRATDRLPRIHPAERDDDLVVGLIVGWGTVAREDGGWRSRFARPDAILLLAGGRGPDADRLRAVASAYGILLLAAEPAAAA